MILNLDKSSRFRIGIALIVGVLTPPLNSGFPDNPGIDLLHFADFLGSVDTVFLVDGSWQHFGLLGANLLGD